MVRDVYGQAADSSVARGPRRVILASITHKNTERTVFRKDTMPRPRLGPEEEAPDGAAFLRD
jgi:hypothetical protein